MAKYLISFPAAAMVVTGSELEAASRDSRKVIREAKAASAYVFGPLAGSCTAVGGAHGEGLSM